MKYVTLALLTAVALTGCEKPAETKPSKAVLQSSTVAKKDGHDHEHGPGPHQGTIFEFGKYHGEFTVDHKTKTVTVYILGDDADTPVAVKTDKLELTIKNPAFTVELKASPDKNDKDGKCSRYVATHDNFAKEQEFEGTVAGVIDGKPTNGPFKEADEHDHKKPEKK